jgi:PAS domain S-box-containing protein
MAADGDHPKTLCAGNPTDPLEAFLAVGTSPEDACHAVLEVLGEGLVITDPAGVVRHATARFADMVGRPADDVAGRHLLEFLDESYGADVIEALGRRTGSVLRLDRVAFRRVGGATLVADVTLTAFRGADRRFAGWLALVRDRTAELRREAEQRRHDDLIRLIADGIPAAIAYINRDERHVFANQAFNEWGYSSRDPLGLTVRQLVGDEVYAEIKPRIEAAFAGETVRYEARRRFSDGRERFIQATYRPHRDDQGRVEGLFVLLHDVTELKLAEQATGASEALLRLVADNLPDLVSYVDRDEVYRFVNQRYARHGWDPDAMVGRTVREVMGEAAWKATRDARLRALAGAPVRYETAWRTPAGEDSFVDITYVPDRRPDGTVHGFVTVIRDVTDLRRAADVLQASEERYRALAESAPDMIFVIDRDLVVRYVNPVSRAAFGGTDQVGRPMAELFPPAEAERQTRSLSAVFETGEPFSREGPSTFGGREYWLHTQLAPMRDGLGNVTAVLGVARDITERRRVETALADSEQRFRALFEAAPFGVILAGYASGAIERCNAAFAAMLGFEPDELVGRSVVELTHPDDRDEQQDTHGAVRAGRIDQYAVEKRYLCKDGASVWARLKGFLLKDAQGRVLQAVGMTEDITEQVRLLDELKHAKGRFEALVEHLPVGVSIVRGDALLYVNPAFCRIYGVERDRVQGVKASSMVVDARTSAIVADARRLRRGEIERLSVRERTQRLDGTPFDVEVTGSQIALPDGPASLFITSDVTREQELEQQLMRAQKMQAIGTLAGGIAHDFNNLLTGIGGHAGFLRSLLDQHALPTDDADGILRLQRRGANLTEKLLALGRRQMIRLVAVDLNRVVRDFAALARRVIGERIELVSDLSPDTPPVMADPLQLEQVLLNLTVNARDAMPSGGTLTLATRPGGDPAAATAVLSVQDTGHGIDPAIVDRIFEPFFTTKEFGKGTGLGLAVAYGIVEQHRGSIRPLDRPDGGTEFRIELPATTSVPAKPGSGMVPAMHDRGGTETILVAEDDENLRDLARRVLERKGYRVLLAADGEEAVALFDREGSKVALVVFDVAMPRKGGIEALAEIRARASDLPAILVSGYSDRLTDGTARDLGSPAFLRKPFSNEQLLHEVRKALDDGGSSDGRGRA